MQNHTIGKRSEKKVDKLSNHIIASKADKRIFLDVAAKRLG
jgi:hypothetical protein